jgi:hypothetical protein
MTMTKATPTRHPRRAKHMFTLPKLFHVARGLQSREHRRTFTPAAVLLAITMLLSIAPTASANVGETIILRCTHGQSLGGFSQMAYRQALKELSADAEEYTDCSSLIRQAQLAAAASGGRGGEPSGSATTPSAAALAPTPSEQRAITHAGHAGSAPVQVGGQVIHPGVVHADIASAFSSLPTPLLATLAFLLACLLLVVGGVLHNRVRARRSR